MSPPGEDSERMLTGKRSRRRFLSASVGFGMASMTGILSTGGALASGGDVLWEFDAAQVVAAPTVVDGTVYVGTWDDNVYALNANDGSEQWAFQTASNVNTAPMVVDGGVYVACMNPGIMYRLDAAYGTKTWEFRPNDWVNSSPTVADDTVFVGSKDQHLYALDRGVGSVRWKYQTGDAIRGAPTVADGSVYVGSDDLYAFDAQDGSVRWQSDDYSGLDASPTVANKRVFTGRFALNTADGSREWMSDKHPYRSSPTVANGYVVFGADEYIYALDAEDGSLGWEFETGEAIQSSPTVAGGSVFVGSPDGLLYALDVEDGTKLWEFQTDDEIRGSPTVVDGTVFFGGFDGTVYALDAGVTASSEGSRVRLATLGHHNSISNRVTVLQPAFFEVSSLDLPDTADPGLQFPINYGITNTGDVEGTQNVKVTVDGQLVGTQSLTVASGDGQEPGMNYEVPSDAGGQDLSIEVASEDDTATGEVTILQPAKFEVVDVGTNAPVEAGEELQVSFDVSNTGDVSAIQTVEVSVADFDSTSLSIDLGGGETTSETVAFETSEDMIGESSVTVEAEDDSGTASVTVTELSGDGDPAGEDGDGGGIGTTEIAAVGGGGGLLALFGGYVLLRRRDEDDDSPPADGPVTEPSGGSSDSPSPTGATGTSAETGESGTPSGPTTPASPDEPGSAATGRSASSAGDAAAEQTAAAGAAGATATDEDDLDIETRIEEIDALVADARENREAMDYDQALTDTERAIQEAESLREQAEVEAPHRVSEIDPVLTDARDLDEEIRTEREAYRESWERYQALSNTYDELAAQADPVDPDDQLQRLGGLTTKLDRIEEVITDHDFENLAHRIDTLRGNCNDLVEELESGHATIQEARSNVDDLEASLDEAEASLEVGEYGRTIQQLDEVESEIAQSRGLVESYETPELDERLAAVRTRWEDLREQLTEARGPATGKPDEIPTVPRLHLEYSDIQRVEAIGTGGNADVYRARVPTPDDGPIDVAVKEPRMGGVLHDQTVEEVPDSTDPTLSPEAFEQPETSTTDVGQSGNEHVPGGSGTRAWSRDEDIDPDAVDPDYEPGAPGGESEGAPTKIQPGGESESRDTDTEQTGEAKNQLLQEAEKWEKIDDHDYIVGIVDYGDEPLPWITMEYMDGGHIAHRAGEVNMDQALWIAIATTKAVRHAHRRGVAHLDLKPDNILFRTVDDAWDVPKVADWGLSKLLLNHSQSVAGLSTHYAAPEQFDREFGQADDITDIYQLGSVFYELFTGQRPFEGRPAQVMRKVLTADVTPPSEIADLPPELDDILLKALEREKADRYETVVNLRNDLQDVRESL